jgi:hypothetical protein
MIRRRRLITSNRSPTSQQRRIPMADLRTSTSPVSLSSVSSSGSKYAAEFNERLKSDEPLLDVVRWWDSVLGPNIGDDVMRQLSKAESAAFGLSLCADWEASYGAPPVTDKFSTGYHQQECWAELEQARAALLQAS